MSLLCLAVLRRCRPYLQTVSVPGDMPGVNGYLVPEVSKIADGSCHSPCIIQCHCIAKLSIGFLGIRLPSRYVYDKYHIRFLEALL